MRLLSNCFLVLLLLATGAVLGLRAPAADDDGQAIYETRCISCHQEDGSGIEGVFPPLDGTEWVQGEKGRLIRIVLDGMTGETVVKEVTYSGMMPPWKTYLDDAQVAAVLTYIRAAWSNEADAVTPAEVARVRATTASRTQPWTHEELIQDEHSGIPAPADPLGLGTARSDSTDHR